MHELGIVKHVMKTLTDVAAENDVSSIAAVTLRIGEVAGVVNHQLLDCWDYFSEKQELFKGSELRIEQVKAITFCEDCRREYETVAHGKICPHCGSENTFLVQGNEFEIKEIDVPELSLDIQ